MKRITFMAITAVFSIGIVLPCFSGAQPPRYDRLADAHVCLETEPCTLHSGVVAQVILWQYTEFQEDPNHAVVLKINGAEGEYLAYMGPVRFHERMGNEFRVGDRIEMQGVVATIGSSDMVICSSFTGTNGTLAIRDEKGKLISLK